MGGGGGGGEGLFCKFSFIYRHSNNFKTKRSGFSLADPARWMCSCLNFWVQRFTQRAYYSNFWGPTKRPLWFTQDTRMRRQCWLTRKQQMRGEFASSVLRAWEEGVWLSRCQRRTATVSSSDKSSGLALSSHFGGVGPQANSVTWIDW